MTYSPPVVGAGVVGKDVGDGVAGAGVSGAGVARAGVGGMREREKQWRDKEGKSTFTILGSRAVQHKLQWL